jgi:methionyl aminopeptidase
MPITINNQEDIERMRIAGKLASEVLDFITPFIKPSITTEKIDSLCHDFMTNKQGTIPAPLNYAPPGHTPFPKSICTSVNNQICHCYKGWLSRGYKSYVFCWRALNSSKKTL